jgi:hypothetical protein
MMLEKLFQAENLPILFGFSIVLFLLIFEAGYRIGRKRRTAIDEPTRAWVTAIYSAILAMLGLLLGFSWAMAQQRFEARRQLVVEEANAIGTMYLRAQWLPQPHRGDVSNLLRQYVDVRLPKGFESRNMEEVVRETSVLSERLQDQLWVQAVDVAQKNPTPVVALFLSSLNETIDLHAKRLAEFRNRVPESVLLLLYLFATVAMLITGYGSGLRTVRCVLPTVAMVVLLSTSLFVIVDLDRPRQGLISVSQESMIRLQQKLTAGSETPAPVSGQRTK